MGGLKPSLYLETLSRLTKTLSHLIVIPKEIILINIFHPYINSNQTLVK